MARALKHRDASWSRQGNWSLAELVAVFANVEVESWCEDGRPSCILHVPYVFPFEVREELVDSV